MLRCTMDLKTNRQKSEKVGVNWLLLSAVAALVIIGLVFVYSASMYSAQKDFGNKYYFLTKQLVGALVGVVALAAMIFIPLDKAKKICLAYVYNFFDIVGVGVCTGHRHRKLRRKTVDRYRRFFRSAVGNRKIYIRAVGGKIYVRQLR